MTKTDAPGFANARRSVLFIWTTMKKDQVEQIRIEVKADGQSALSMLIHKDGTLNRQGNGSLPPVKLAAIGMTDGSVFRQLMTDLDENIFEHAGIYDHPDKRGQQLNYSVVFLGQKPNLKVFEFRVGSETKNVGNVLPYLDQFISKAAILTNEWYDKSQKGEAVLPDNTANSSSPQTKKPWYKFWC